MPYTPTYTYDAENRVKAVNGVTYTYDGDGNRVLKSSGTLYWGWGSGNGPLAESDLSASSTSWKEYVFFNGNRVARRDASNSTVHYFFSNHVGSTSMIVNSSTGAVEEDVDYYPYGGLAYGASSDHYLFDGKERDSETGNDNFGARYYGSGMGRFLTPDWAARPTAIPYAVFGDPQSLNLYTMVRNDPVTLADADGHVCQDNNPGPCEAIGENQKAAGEKAKAESAKSNDAAKAAQNTTPPPPPPATPPKKGFGILPTGTGAVDLGVGKAGVTAQGSVSPVGGFIDNKGHPHVGAEASGSLDAYAGQHTAATPKQDKDSFVVGAFAGVGAGVTLTNAGNAPAMKSMTNTLNIDLGLGPAASISISSGHSGVSSITITLGWGYGAAVTETNTGTATLPSQ